MLKIIESCSSYIKFRQSRLQNKADHQGKKIKHYLTIKELIFYKGITVPNVYAPKNRT